MFETVKPDNIEVQCWFSYHFGSAVSLHVKKWWHLTSNNSTTTTINVGVSTISRYAGLSRKAAMATHLKVFNATIELIFDE